MCLFFMLKKFSFVFLLLASFAGKAQIVLSDSAKVSILTVSAGSALYSTFGHSIIRIIDPLLGIDQNYNYGSFNTNTSFFYLKFLRGQLPYQISSHAFDLEYNFYSSVENRGIKEQVLNLSKLQKQRLFDLLEENLLPQNRDYSYKFFYDNCSSRIRDMLLKSTDNAIAFNKELNIDSTYRNYVSYYSDKNKMPWADFSMNLAIGLPSDQKTGYWNAMFLPDKLYDALRNAKIRKGNEWANLVINENIIWEESPNTHKPFFTPLFIFALVFGLVLVLTFFQIYKKLRLKFLDNSLFLSVGIAGWILAFLWWGTNHGVTVSNPHLLWAFPFLFPCWLFLKRNKQFLLIILILQLLFILMVVVKLINVPIAALLIVLTLSVRIIYLRFYA
jgi:hypothetical protein